MKVSKQTFHLSDSISINSKRSHDIDLTSRDGFIRHQKKVDTDTKVLLGIIFMQLSALAILGYLLIN